VIVNCTACYNSGDGIFCISDCFITGNTASYNAKGIHTVGSLNRIDGNTANHNTQYGILWGNDIMIRNSAFANTTLNYNPAAGTGNSGPLNVSSTSTSPWANF
jgi:parallel beta-helix repeat protein